MLRAAREKQGLHIAALAAAIKVTPRKLDALENDRWHELPDATFTRALAQTVCRTLKIDARPVLDLLPAPGAVVLEPASNVLNEPFHERPGQTDGGFAASAIRPMVWAAAALMLAAVAVYFLPPGLWRAGLGIGDPPQASAPVPAPLPAAASGPAMAVTPPAEAASSYAATPASQPAASAAPLLATTLPAPAAASAPVTPVSPPAAGGETVFAAPPPSVAPAAVPAVAGIVQLRSTEASWMEIRDARGTVLLKRTVLPGESVGLNGSLPIRLTIGNAAATQLLFRGQAVDLVARTRDNVARVELQ